MTFALNMHYICYTCAGGRESPLGGLRPPRPPRKEGMHRHFAVTLGHFHGAWGHFLSHYDDIG